MKRLKPIALVLTLLIIGFYFYARSFPTSWSMVNLGMSKPQVVAITGQPTQDTGDVKGCFWFNDRPFVHHHLCVVFNSQGQAVLIYVERRIGTPTDYFRKNRFTKSAA